MARTREVKQGACKRLPGEGRNQGRESKDGTGIRCPGIEKLVIPNDLRVARAGHLIIESQYANAKGKANQKQSPPYGDSVQERGKPAICVA